MFEVCFLFFFFCLVAPKHCFQLKNKKIIFQKILTNENTSCLLMPQLPFSQFFFLIFLLLLFSHDAGVTFHDGVIH